MIAVRDVKGFSEPEEDAQVTDGRENDRKKAAEMIDSFNLFDDYFMSYILQNKEACTYVLRVLMGIEDLVLDSVNIEFKIPEVIKRSARLDVVAFSRSRGKVYNIEVQNATSGLDHKKRVRFYGSALDKSFLDRGGKFSGLPDVYVIYLTRDDIFKFGYSHYCVKNFLIGMPASKNCGDYDDGKHYMFVNAEVQDGSLISRLMDYFKNTDPNCMDFGDLSERVYSVKVGKERVVMIDRLMELADKKQKAEYEKGIIAVIRSYRKEGKDDHTIAEFIKDSFGLSDDKVRELMVRA